MSRDLLRISADRSITWRRTEFWRRTGQQDGRRVLPRHRFGYRRRGDRGLVVQPVRHARGHRVERLQSHRGRHRSCGFLGGLPRDPATHCVIPIRTFYTTGMEHSPTSAKGTGWERMPGTRYKGSVGGPQEGGNELIGSDPALSKRRGLRQHFTHSLGKLVACERLGDQGASCHARHGIA